MNSTMSYDVADLIILHEQALQKWTDTGDYAWEISSALLEGLIEGLFDAALSE